MLRQLSATLILFAAFAANAQGQAKKPPPPKPAPPTPAAPDAPKSDDPLGFAGLWKGNCPGTSESTVYLKVTKEGEKYTAEGHVLNKAKQYVGHFAPTEGKVGLVGKEKEQSVAFEGAWDAGLVGSRFEPKYRLTHVKGVVSVICSANRSVLTAAAEADFAGLKPPDKVAVKPKEPGPPAKPNETTNPNTGSKPVETVKINLPPNTPPTEPAQKFDLPAQGFNTSFSRDGKTLAVISYNAGKVSALSTFDIAADKPLWTRTDIAKDANWKINSVGISPDGKRVACDPGVTDRSIVLVDGATGKSIGAPLKTGADHLAFHPTKPLLAFTHTAPKTYMTVVDLSTGKALWKADNIHNGNVFDLVFSPKGDIVATLGRDVAKPDTNRVRLFDAAKGTTIHDFPAVKGGVASLSFTADGQRLAFYHWEKATIVIYDVATKEVVKAITGFPNGSSHNKMMAFSPDGKTIALGTWSDGHLRLVDVEGGKTRGVIIRAFNLSSGLGDIAWTPDGEKIAVVNDKQVKVYRVADAKPVE